SPMRFVEQHARQTATAPVTPCAYATDLPLRGQHAQITAHRYWFTRWFTQWFTGGFGEPHVDGARQEVVAVSVDITNSLFDRKDHITNLPDPVYLVRGELVAGYDVDSRTSHMNNLHLSGTVPAGAKYL